MKMLPIVTAGNKNFCIKKNRQHYRIQVNLSLGFLGLTTVLQRIVIHKFRTISENKNEIRRVAIRGGSTGHWNLIR